MEARRGLICEEIPGAKVIHSLRVLIISEEENSRCRWVDQSCSLIWLWWRTTSASLTSNDDCCDVRPIRTASALGWYQAVEPKILRVKITVRLCVSITHSSCTKTWTGPDPLRARHRLRWSALVSQSLPPLFIMSQWINLLFPCAEQPEGLCWLVPLWYPGIWTGFGSDGGQRKRRRGQYRPNWQSFRSVALWLAGWDL